MSWMVAASCESVLADPTRRTVRDEEARPMLHLRFAPFAASFAIYQPWLPVTCIVLESAAICSSRARTRASYSFFISLMAATARTENVA